MREDDANSLMCGQQIDIDGEVPDGRAAPSKRDVIVVCRQLVAGEILGKTKLGVDSGCVPDHASVSIARRGLDPV